MNTIKTIKKECVLFTLLCVCSSFIALAQQRKPIDNTVTNRVSEIFTFDNQVSNFLINQQANSISTTNQNSQFNNSVFINQVGVRNEVVSITTSNNTVSEFEQIGNDNFINSINTIDNLNEVVVQNGNDNFFSSQNTVQNASSSVVQNGNNNRFTNFSFGNVNESSLNLIQNGDNLTFEKFGTNSLTNSLQFVQQGNARTITVRSF